MTLLIFTLHIPLSKCEDVAEVNETVLSVVFPAVGKV